MPSVLGLFAVGFPLYLLTLVIYRLFLSPLARFPGSKLTAASGWYETYLDVYRGGQFTFRIEEWHKRYGPIIRINPWEIHISDPEYYDVLYSNNTSFDKMQKWNKRFNGGAELQATVEHDIHHRRRVALNPYFSKRQILNFSPHIQGCAEKLSNKLIREFKDTPKVVSLNDAYAAFTGDIVCYYSFAWSYNFLDYEDFVAPFAIAVREVANAIHVFGHFPWVRAFVASLPDRFLALMNPSMRPIFQFQKEIERQIISIRDGENEEHKYVAHKTIFSDLFAADLPTQEKDVTSFQNQAAGIVGAGIETTRAVMTLASFHILSQPEILKRLRQELEAAFPDLARPPTLTELERLPYLTAVIHEALRLSYGVSQRLPRISPRQPMYYSSYIIPPGTPVSMTTYICHHNESIFPDSHSFNPDRWLNNPKVVPLKPATATTNTSHNVKESKPLTRYLVSFSKGTRMCLGMNLAWAELYIGLANVFRRVDMELWETGRGDVELRRDYFLPLAEVGSRGVRVKVK
ncbi:MAG: hypothetical protein Q9190_002381 [Brigantiaea leucoxantha]